MHRDGAFPLVEIPKNKCRFSATSSTPWNGYSDNLELSGQKGKSWWPVQLRTCSVDCRRDKWQLDRLFPLLSAPLIRCCQLGHSYLCSTFTPRSWWRGKGQQPTKALGEDESQKDEILNDLHLLTKKFKPQTNALVCQTGMCLVVFSVLFSLSQPTVITHSSTQP